MLSIVQYTALDKGCFSRVYVCSNIERMIKRVHVFASGRVQGVFFRAHTQEKARALGLAGWVRNLPDGRVELVAEGEEANLAALLEWVQVGPSSARVEGVQADWSTPQGEKGFRIRYE
jgi:acylphosphatase